MKFNKEKFLSYGALFLLMAFISTLAGCTMPTKELDPGSSTGNANEITLEGLVLTNETIFIAKSKSSGQLKHELISIQMPENSESKTTGSLVQFVIKSTIRESYPMQATGISATVLRESTPVIKAPIDVGPKIISHMPQDAYLIDVRTPKEFSDGHIEGARNLPLNDLETLIANEVPDKDKTILLYCRSGNRSATAGKLLKNLGYTIVFDLGGIKG